MSEPTWRDTDLFKRNSKADLCSMVKDRDREIQQLRNEVEQACARAVENRVCRKGEILEAVKAAAEADEARIDAEIELQDARRRIIALRRLPGVNGDAEAGAALQRLRDAHGRTCAELEEAGGKLAEARGELEKARREAADWQASSIADRETAEERKAKLDDALDRLRRQGVVNERLMEEKADAAESWKGAQGKLLEMRSVAEQNQKTIDDLEAASADQAARISRLVNDARRGRRRAVFALAAMSVGWALTLTLMWLS